MKYSEMAIRFRNKRVSPADALVHRNTGFLRSKLILLFSHRHLVISYVLAGILMMICLVHPVLEGIHRWRSGLSISLDLQGFILQPVLDSFSGRMWPMTLALGIVGAISGLGLAFLHLRILTYRQNNWEMDIDSDGLRRLMKQEESEHLEFKSSLRWDRKLNKVNKTLEAVIAKTLAGFMNHQGGILLIGIDDDRAVPGIEADWNSLRYANWDGFEERFVSLITNFLGAQFTSLVHCECLTLTGKAVAVIRIKPASIPVFCREGNIQRYYLRAGNTTRKLDTQEALAHIAGKRMQ